MLTSFQDKTNETQAVIVWKPFVICPYSIETIFKKYEE